MEKLLNNFVLVLLVSLTLSGCSKSSSHSQKGKAPAGTLPFTVTMVDTPEFLESKAVAEQCKSLFQSKKYEELEALATKYRKSQEHTPDGFWKLNYVFGGLSIPRASTDEEWEAHLNALREWIRARPKSITPRIALADELLDYAWKARGGGTVDTITEQGR